MEINKTVELLSILVSSGSGGIENVVRTNVKTVIDKLKSDEQFAFLQNCVPDEDRTVDDDTTWQFIKINLGLLLRLHSTLESAIANEPAAEKVPKLTSGPPLPGDALSISQLKTVGAALQFIICLGVCPYLLPGVGLPLERRSGFGHCLEATKSSSTLSRDEMDFRLLRCTKDLLMCTVGDNSTVLSRMIITKHLGDLLAALFQINHCLWRKYPASSGCSTHPLHSGEFKLISDDAGESILTPNVSGDSKVTPDDSGESKLTPEAKSSAEQTLVSQCADSSSVESRISMADVEFCVQSLDSLLVVAYQPTLIQQLLLLQNGIPPSSKIKPTDTADVRPPSPPVWLKKFARNSLVWAFTRPQGIQSLFAVLLQDSAETMQTAEWKKYEAVARIVVDCRLGNSISVENYYEKISSQIIDLLRMNTQQLGRDSMPAGHLRQCLRATVQMICRMSSSQPLLTERFLFNDLLQPLMQCLKNPVEVPTAECKSNDVVVGESLLTNCINDVHTIFVESSNPGNELVKFLHPVLGVFLRLYCFVRQSITFLRKKVEDIVHHVFRHLDLNVALDFLKSIFLEDDVDSSCPSVAQMSQCLCFTSGESGGISVVVQTEKRSALDISQLELTADNVVTLLTSSKRQEDIGAEFFLLCLKSMTEMLSKEVDSTSQCTFLGQTGKVISGSRLLDSGDVVDDVAKTIQRNLKVLSLTAAICDGIGSSCLSKTPHILSFVEVTLRRGAKILKSTDDSIFGAFETETMTMALGLLTSLLSTKEKLSASDWTQLQELLPILLEISESDVDPSLQEMTLDLRIAIATHGLVRSDTNKSKSSQAGRAKLLTTNSDLRSNKTTEQHKAESKEDDKKNVFMPAGKKEEKRKPLIEVLNSTDVDGSETSEATGVTVKQERHTDSACKSAPVATKQSSISNSSTLSSDESTSSKQTPYMEAFEELCNSDVAVRGHGLIALRRLIESKDSETLENSENILKVCDLNLSHADSYIYLPTIHVMAALANRFPQLVVRRLAAEYGQSSKGTKRTTELRMKLGEVLVKVSSNLGEMIPSYRDVLLNAALGAAKDGEPLIRASAICNLGVICQHLRFSLGNFIEEIYSCIESLLKYDSSVEVRRSAAMFCTLLFHGLSKDMFKILNNLSRSFLRLLVDVQATEKDDIVKLHVQLSIDELRSIIHEFLTPSQDLSKHIRILGPFDSD